MSDMNKNNLESLVGRFEDTDDIEIKLEVLTELSRLKAVHSLREDARFLAGLESIENLANNKNEEIRCLLAIAALGRIGRTKSLSARVDKSLKLILETPIPSLDLLKDPDNRYYVAVTLNGCNTDWVREYASKFIVIEKQAEKARQELVNVLLNRSNSIADAFREIAITLKELHPDTQAPGDSVAKRLERIIKALRPIIVSMLIEPGDEIGKSINELFHAGFIGVKKPESLNVVKKLADEAISLIHDIVRTQISVAAEASVYGAVSVVSNWFPQGGWVLFSRKSKNVEILANDLQQAITLLAKQGITDSELFDQLSKIVGSRESATNITVKIAEHHSEIDAEIREWLRKGGKVREKRKLTALIESDDLAADAIIASLMNDSDKFVSAINSIPSSDMEEFKIMEPNASKAIELVLKRGGSLSQGIAQLARKRGLQLKGDVGEVVEYSSVSHELINTPSGGVRRVKIIRPIIERVSIDGSITVVQKALVDAV